MAQSAASRSTVVSAVPSRRTEMVTQRSVSTACADMPSLGGVTFFESRRNKGASVSSSSTMTMTDASTTDVGAATTATETTEAAPKVAASLNLGVLTMLEREILEPPQSKKAIIHSSTLAHSWTGVPFHDSLPRACCMWCAKYLVSKLSPVSCRSISVEDSCS